MAHATGRRLGLGRWRPLLLVVLLAAELPFEAAAVQFYSRRHVGPWIWFEVSLLFLDVFLDVFSLVTFVLCRAWWYLALSSAAALHTWRMASVHRLKVASAYGHVLDARRSWSRNEYMPRFLATLLVEQLFHSPAAAFLQLHGLLARPGFSPLQASTMLVSALLSLRSMAQGLRLQGGLEGDIGKVCTDLAPFKLRAYRQMPGFLPASLLTGAEAAFRTTSLAIVAVALGPLTALASLFFDWGVFVYGFYRLLRDVYNPDGRPLDNAKDALFTALSCGLVPLLAWEGDLVRGPMGCNGELWFGCTLGRAALQVLLLLRFRSEDFLQVFVLADISDTCSACRLAVLLLAACSALCLSALLAGASWRSGRLQRIDHAALERLEADAEDLRREHCALTARLFQRSPVAAELEAESNPLLGGLSLDAGPEALGPEGGEEDESSGHLSVLQFSTAQYFCGEDDGEASIDVVRLGDAQGAAYCFFRTVDGSAKAGVNYMAVAGHLTFELDETMKSFTVPLVTNEDWNATLDFSVVLFRARNAQLGQYLYRCHVSILDDDVFPTNKYRTAFATEEDVAKVGGNALMFELLRMLLKSSTLTRSVLRLILLDQIKNAYFLLTVYLQMLLVDVVFQGSGAAGDAGGAGDVLDERRLLFRDLRLGARRLRKVPGEGAGGALGERRITAVVIATCYVVPFLAHHAADILKINRGIGGTIRKTLQCNLLRRFLVLRDQVRSCISTGDLTMAMTRDIHEVVDLGCVKILHIICMLLKLLCESSFVLAKNSMAAVPLALFPFLGAATFKLRQAHLVRSTAQACLQENELIQNLGEVLHNCNLISSLRLQGWIANRYEHRAGALNSTQTENAILAANTTYLMSWCTTLLVGGYMIYGIFQLEALGGTLSLGAYFATIQIFKTMGGELGEVYSELMEVQKTEGSLEKLCYFMNQPTDLNQRMLANRARRKEGRMRWRDARKSGGILGTQDGIPVFAVDTIDIRVDSVSFAYPMRPPLLRNASVLFRQGRLYAMVGEELNGKATLLKIIGQVLLPDRGDMFIPPHLRVLHVASGRFRLNASFLDNIIFDQGLRQAGGYVRVRRVCKACGFSAAMLEALDESSRDGARAQGLANPALASPGLATPAWVNKLSGTGFARLSLARALVMDPECLVLHMPVVSFQDAEARRIVRLLRKHVDERGLALPNELQRFRRPRTVFFSSAHADRVGFAHELYAVKEATVHLLRSENARSSVLGDRNQHCGLEDVAAEGHGLERAESFEST